MEVAANANYVYDFSRTLNGITYQGAGCSGNCYYGGGEKFQGSLDFNYSEGAWNFGTVFKILGESVMDLGNLGNPLIGVQGVSYSRTSVDSTLAQNIASVGSGQRDLITGAIKNYNAAVVRTDLRVQYKMNSNMTLFAAVDNVQNLPTAGGQLRRLYRGGLRWREVGCSFSRPFSLS